MATILASALEYLEMGFSVIPIMPRGKLPQANVLPGYGERKASWVKYQRALPERSEVEDWFATRPRLNLAIVTGKVSNLVVVDIDNPEALDQFEDIFYPDYDGDQTDWFVRTGRGYHVYFNYPEGVEIRNRTHFREGIDIRADGGYVLAPPSIHPSGRQYRWDHEIAPHILVRPNLPASLLDLLVRPESERPTFKPVRATFGSPLARHLFDRFLRELARSEPDNHNNTLNRVAFQLARIVAAGALDEGECREALRIEALAVGQGESETQRTIDSAFRAGLALPWQFHEGKKTR